MTRCPDDQLHRLSNHELSSPEAAAVALHLGGCPSCQRTVEEFTIRRSEPQTDPVGLDVSAAGNTIVNLKIGARFTTNPTPTGGFMY